MDIISTEKAPQALGPYSQAVRANGFIFCSGQIPIDPAAGAVVATTAEDQARQAITNLRHVLEAAGSGLDKVVKTTVFISDMNDFAVVNGVYAELFGDTKPARSCVQAARLPKDVKLEIEAVAVDEQ
jgi:2-iminobutanoate/2-iminopropanoate deaminase